MEFSLNVQGKGCAFYVSTNILRASECGLTLRWLTTLHTTDEGERAVMHFFCSFAGIRSQVLCVEPQSLNHCGKAASSRYPIIFLCTGVPEETEALKIGTSDSAE